MLPIMPSDVFYYIQMGLLYGLWHKWHMQEVEFEENYWKPILQKLTSFYEEVTTPTQSPFFYNNVKIGVMNTGFMTNYFKVS